MATITGIVAEFNPFHNGHKYLLDQAKGTKIVVMSGNWLQRGEPAVIDKWTRAQMAVLCGADLVLELPVLSSVQGADFFANGSLELLARVGIDNLVFGTESNIDYDQVLEIYRNQKPQMDAYLAGLPKSMSYPEKTQAMWSEFTGISFSGDSPNHVLALAYLKGIAKYKPSIRMNGIKRQGQAFHSQELAGDFASATAIRQGLEKNEDVASFLPTESYDLLQHKPAVSWKNFYQLLKYKIISTNLSSIFQMNEELEVRIKAASRKASDFDDLVNKVHTKRYTKARVRRLLTYVLLDIKKTDFDSLEKTQGVRILAMSARGRSHVKELKDQVKFISRVGKDPWDPLSQRADDIYRLGDPGICEQNYGRIPYIKA
ncbi:nucleotidyltransferase [Streptococcaceae bacterium ESL0729]|nr:nucleotidyltransferase [Streptococcaceae bacterium ESL0729]